MSILRITIDNDLPIRQRGVDDGTLARIFGGCKTEGMFCDSSWQCCSHKYTVVCVRNYCQRA